MNWSKKIIENIIGEDEDSKDNFYNVKIPKKYNYDV